MGEQVMTAEGIRARARRELVEAIKQRARAQLASTGLAGLSLRGIARDVGMASSALYRYFASRDDLLTALIVDAYNDLGEAAEQAVAAAPHRDSMAQWLAVCRAVRQWSLAHPQQYALIYGSPQPGYHAPAVTIPPASRVGLVLANVVVAAAARGELSPGELGHSVPDAVAHDAAALAAELEFDLPASTLAALVAAWAQLFGLVSFELFGQFHNLVHAREEFFDHSARQLATSVGL